MKKTLANPVKMIELGAPRLIRSDAELERYTEALFDLTAKAKPSVAEIEAINLLSLLVETYEASRFPMETASPVELLRFLMEQNGLQQRDLMPELGSESNVSLILAGKRNLTVQHIQRLSRRFGLPVSVFVESRTAAA
jgi:HTH-type transcriptional regulator/antitoxin HigA